MQRTEYEHQLLQKVIASIETHGGRKLLSSVILTGSFGRDEASYLISGEELRLISDVEIALVYRPGISKKSVAKLIHSVSQEFEEDLNLMGIGEGRVKGLHNYNYTLFSPKYKTVFTYDLVHGSKTIWGTDFLSDKKTTAILLDPYEAKRLVANRIGELVYLQSASPVGERDRLRKQWKGKVLLALASAWLIGKGEYVSSYAAQKAKIAEHREEVDAFFGEGFFSAYEKVFAFLREGAAPYEIEDDLLRGFVYQAQLAFDKAGVKKSKVTCFARQLKYRLKYVKAKMPYGIFGFENKILSALIAGYAEGDEHLDRLATIWFGVLC